MNFWGLPVSIERVGNESTALVCRLGVSKNDPLVCITNRDRGAYKEGVPWDIGVYRSEGHVSAQAPSFTIVGSRGRTWHWPPKLNYRLDCGSTTYEVSREDIGKCGLDLEQVLRVLSLLPNETLEFQTPSSGSLKITRI